MVYAVAMTTIDRFERALGRKAFWTERILEAKEDERFVQRLRIYPHTLDTFPGTEDPTLGQFPAGMCFTCLSHVAKNHVAKNYVAKNH